MPGAAGLLELADAGGDGTVSRVPPERPPSPPGLRWSFATEAPGGDQWSAQRFDSAAAAADAATTWMLICADNNFFPHIRIGRQP